MLKQMLMVAAMATGVLPRGEGEVNGLDTTTPLYDPPVMVHGSPAEPLAGAGEGTALERALGYFLQHHEDLNLAKEDVGNLVVTGETRSAASGISHVFLRQQVGGIEVVGTEANLSVGPRGEILMLRHRFMAGLADAVDCREPAITAPQAAESSARHLRLEPVLPFEVLEQSPRPDRKTRLSSGGIAVGEIEVRLVYRPIAPGRVALAWQLEFEQFGAPHLWQITVHASTGEVLELRDHTAHSD